MGLALGRVKLIMMTAVHCGRNKRACRTSVNRSIFHHCCPIASVSQSCNQRHTQQHNYQQDNGTYQTMVLGWTEANRLNRCHQFSGNRWIRLHFVAWLKHFDHFTNMFRIIIVCGLFLFTVNRNITWLIGFISGIQKSIDHLRIIGLWTGFIGFIEWSSSSTKRWFRATGLTRTIGWLTSITTRPNRRLEY